MFFSLSIVGLISVLAGRVSAHSTRYKLDSVIQGAQYFDEFDFFNASDPTNGFVDYLDEDDAKGLNLTFATDKSFFMKVEDKEQVTAGERGRKSVRITSKAAHDLGVVILDVVHMPQGCGTWPAYWSVTDHLAQWPVGGEIDILEMADDNGNNLISLHTSPGCTMPATGRNETGLVMTTDCSAFDNFNSGCGVRSSNPFSGGPRFNANGGGWYVMERTNHSISTWFFARSDPNVPHNVKHIGTNFHMKDMPEPDAYFPNTDCDIPDFFGRHNMVVDTTLCGDLAGQPWLYNSSGCPSTCQDFVAHNPQNFTNAYWELGAMRFYV